MFDISGLELLVIMVIALLVIGPKDLPVAIRTVTTVVRKVRGMANEFQRGLDEIAREAGVDEIKRSVDDVVTYDPKEALDALGELDDGEFSVEAGTEAPQTNSILDPAAAPAQQSGQRTDADGDVASQSQPDPAQPEPASNQDDGSQPARPAASNS